MAKATVLVADDDGAIRVVLNQALTRAGFNVRVTSNVSTLWQWIINGEGHCVVSDVIMPDGEAYDILPRIRSERPELPVILISAQNTFMTALKAEEAGAYEYIPKPFDLDELTATVSRAIEEPKDTHKERKSADNPDAMPLVGRSPAMQELYRTIARLRQSDLPVILSGEGGSGKALTARVLHDFGSRMGGAFVKLNLATLPVDEIELRLFGSLGPQGTSEDGAIARASGGTLYLENIDRLPAASQNRFLNILIDNAGASQINEAHFRLISSASGDLPFLVERSEFSKELYYRINVVPVHLLPLRDRMDDIADLARHFLGTIDGVGAHIKHLEPDAIARLKSYPWPGNVRE
ncbi:MAG: sigma-54 dependent transcriptional regulator, partial [Pseudomonadota bacterium]